MIVTIELTDESKSCWTPNQNDFQVWIECVLEELRCTKPTTVSIRLVNLEEAFRLNSRHRNKDYAANVLSFPANLPNQATSVLYSKPIGDIVICPEIVQREADEQKKTIHAHWAHLLIHSTLHLEGFHHETKKEAESMEKQEIKVLKKLGFPNPYLIV